MRTLGRLACIKDPKCMYDIGVGPLPKQEAQLFKNFYKEIEIFGCEPHPGICQQRKDSFPGTLHELGISSATGARLLYEAFDEKGTPSMSNIYNVPNVSERTFEIRCVTLDVFDEMCMKPDRIVLWMDIEGAEVEAIRSGPRLMESGRVRWINIEVRTVPRTEQEKINLELIPQLLSDFGYVKKMDYQPMKTHHDELWVKK